MPPAARSAACTSRCSRKTISARRRTSRFPSKKGQRYYLAKLDFTGVKLFRSTEFLSRIFQMQQGDVFSTEKLRNGIKNMTKLYSQFGYIDYVGEPQIDIVPNTNKIDLTLNVDEGKQFFVRRIEFTGNTTTRDKVIRRELLIDEGDVYNSQLWDASILRLNQLGYFETLKENEAYTLNRNPGTNTVDINLKVKERGKNSISLNGGVSGIAGTFVGLNYSTNNFLGLGETLSIGGQVGTLTDDVNVGFTEPYLFDRPLQAGVSLYLRRFDYNQGRQISLLEGVNVTGFYNALGSANVLNYIQNSKGISLSLSYPIKRSFARLGLSIGYDDSSIVTKSDRRADLLYLPELPGRQRSQCAERHQDRQHHAVVHLQLEEQLPEPDGRQEHLLLDAGRGQRSGREREHDPAHLRRPVLSRQPALAQERARVPSDAPRRCSAMAEKWRRRSREPSWAARTTCAASSSTRSRRWLTSRAAPPRTS